MCSGSSTVYWNRQNTAGDKLRLYWRNSVCNFLHNGRVIMQRYVRRVWAPELLRRVGSCVCYDVSLFRVTKFDLGGCWSNWEEEIYQLRRRFPSILFQSELRRRKSFYRLPYFLQSFLDNRCIYFSKLLQNPLESNLINRKMQARRSSETSLQIFWDKQTKATIWANTYC